MSLNIKSSDYRFENLGPQIIVLTIKQVADISLPVYGGILRTHRPTLTNYHTGRL